MANGKNRPFMYNIDMISLFIQKTVIKVAILTTVIIIR